MDTVVGVMLDVGSPGSLLDHTFIDRACLLFSLSFANRLATIYASRLLQLHLIPLPYP